MTFETCLPKQIMFQLIFNSSCSLSYLSINLNQIKFCAKPNPINISYVISNVKNVQSEI